MHNPHFTKLNEYYNIIKESFKEIRFYFYSSLWDTFPNPDPTQCRVFPGPKTPD